MFFNIVPSSLLLELRIIFFNLKFLFHHHNHLDVINHHIGLFNELNLLYLKCNYDFLLFLNKYLYLS